MLPAVRATGDHPIFQALAAGRALGRLLKDDPGAVHARQAATGDTPLLVAAESGSRTACLALLAAGAPIDAPAEDRSTAFLYALRCGHAALARLLLERGASLRARRKGGTTAMHYAAQSCSPATIAWLAGEGATLDGKRERGVTPVLLAVQFGRVPAVRALLRLGADVLGARLQMNTGGPTSTCLEIAALASDLPMLRLLAPLAWTRAQRDLALAVAAGDGHLQACKILVAHGADPTAPAGSRRRSAIERARQHRHRAVCAWLQSKVPDRA
jgi:ankyrin repeat protein